MNDGPANELVLLISKRLGIKPDEISCPRERSGFTPCVARDGWTAQTNNGKCVGCGADVAGLLSIEKSKHQD